MNRKYCLNLDGYNNSMAFHGIGPTWLHHVMIVHLCLYSGFLTKLMCTPRSPWSISIYLVCRIKTGHWNLVSCFGPRWGRWLRYFTEAKPAPESESTRTRIHRIWITGLNPNYDWIPIPSLQNSQNKCPKSSFSYNRRRHLIMPFPPVRTLPTLNARTCC